MPRLALILSDSEQVEDLLHWSWRLARGASLPLEIVVWRTQDQPSPERRIPLVAEQDDEDNSVLITRLRELIPLAADFYREGDKREKRLPTIWDLRGPQPVAQLIQRSAQQDWKLVVLPERTLHRGSVDLRAFWQSAPADIMVIRPAACVDEEFEQLDNIQVAVPVAGGMHTVAALRWADVLRPAQLQAVHVLPEDFPEAQETGTIRVSRWLKRLQIQASDWQMNILQHDNPLRVLTDAVAGQDLVVIGAGSRPFDRSALGYFGERIVKQHGDVAVAVVHRKRLAVSRWWQRIDDRLSLWMPRLDREKRVEVAEQLLSQSRCSFDFLLLLSLATVLAGLGLIQSSAPVVVGAMLVAPLMSPLLSSGLALVQANRQLLKGALKTVFWGVSLSIGLGIILGSLASLLGVLDANLSPELLARGNPTLLDLGVAIVSGFAAAYAIARSGLIAALAGVAIAAALVPPLATIGIAMTQGVWTVASGAALLFSVNVVAVILGSAISLSLLGLGATRTGVPLWLRRVVLFLLLALGALAVPLTAILYAKHNVNGYLSVDNLTEELSPILEQYHWQLRDAQLNPEGVLRLELAMTHMPAEIPWSALRQLSGYQSVEIIPVLVAPSKIKSDQGR